MMKLHYTNTFTSASHIPFKTDFKSFSLFLSSPGTPRFSGQPEARSVRLGDSQVLSCEVNTDLMSFVRWEREKVPVQLDQRVYTLPSGALVISNATETDAGLYRCVLENAGPTKMSDEAQLHVLPGKPLGFLYLNSMVSNASCFKKYVNNLNKYKQIQKSINDIIKDVRLYNLVHY